MPICTVAVLSDDEPRRCAQGAPGGASRESANGLEMSVTDGAVRGLEEAKGLETSVTDGAVSGLDANGLAFLDGSNRVAGRRAGAGVLEMDGGV